MDWSVRRGSGSSLLFTNQTGETVTDVAMNLRGHAVGGMIARRDWSMELDKMDAGEALKAPFRAEERRPTRPAWRSPGPQPPG